MNLKKLFVTQWGMGVTLLFIVMLLSGLPLNAQDVVTVTGTVRDTEGEAVIGASVMVVQQPNIGATTNLDGEFTLSKVSKNATIRISFVGMKTAEIRLAGKTHLNVTLETDNELLDEIVVVGYGTQKKVNLTGAVNTIKNEELTNKATTSLTNALQGVLPGVTIISRPGNVGGDMGTINIRGRGNLGSSSPLFVIDGIISTEDNFQRLYSGDVESISILKDAAASAIYGSRAAFGVILVTTKKGKEGKTSFTYNGYLGWQTPTVLPKKLGSVDFAKLTDEAYTNAGKDPIYKNVMGEIESGKNPDLYPNNDWYSLLYKSSAPVQEHNLSISGGGQTRYFVSGTWFNQASLIPGTMLDRFSVRANTEREFSDMFTLGTNISYSRDQQERKGDFSITDLDRMTPLTVARHSDGSWGTVTGGEEATTLAENNPLRKLEEYGWMKKNSSRLNLTVNAIYKPIEVLTFNGSISYRAFDSNESKFENQVAPLIGFINKKPMGGTEHAPSKLTNEWYKSQTLISQLFATYAQSFGAHDISVLAGTQYEDFRRDFLKGERKQFASNSISELGAGSSSAENKDNDGNIRESAFLSYFGRVNYAYDSKYLFEANVRFDQSSRFPKNKRIGIFPSFSAAWRITGEDFMKDVTWLNNLKLRASWGKLGNVSNVGYYDYFDALALGGAYTMDGVMQDGAWPAGLPNPNLTWETVTMTNLGLDLAVLNNKFDVQLDLFNKVTSGILLKMPTPYELGLSTASKDKELISTNAGVVSNKGIELIANYREKIGDFNFVLTGNVSKIWNRVEDLNGLDDQISGVWIYRVGEPIGSFYGYKAEGLFKDKNDVENHIKQDSKTAPGDIKYADVNGDKKFSADDRTILGNDVPYFTYGLNFSSNYKGIDLSIQGQGVADVMVYLSGETSQAFFNGASAKEYHLGRWTADNPNPNAIYPRLLPSADNKHNTRTSSFWLYNADYFRIKNIVLGYTLPNAWTSKIGIERARIYATASNLFTIRGDKRMKDFDPEMASARGTYPNLKVMSLGFNINF